MHLPLPPEQLKARLVQENLIAPERFDVLWGEAKRKNQNLIDLLISEKVVEGDYLYGLVAESLGVPLADLGKRTVDEQVLRSLSEEIARQRPVILFAREGDGSVDAAMLDGYRPVKAVRAEGVTRYRLSAASDVPSSVGGRSSGAPSVGVRSAG